MVKVRKKVKKSKRTTKKSAKVVATRIETVPREITFAYEKSRLFRVIHVDGVHGGVTPDLTTVHMALFNERIPISREETYELTPEGTLGDVKEKKTRGGVYREVEVSVLMDLSAARSMRKWLDLVISRAEKALEKRQAHSQQQQ